MQNDDPQEAPAPRHPKQELLHTHVKHIVSKRGVPVALSPILSEAKNSGLISADITPEEAVRIAALVIISDGLNVDRLRRYVPTEEELAAIQPPKAETEGEENNETE